MRQYFEKMQSMGRELTDNERKRMEENVTLIKNEERVIEEAKEKTKNAGIPAEKINQRGENTAWQRLDMLVDPGTFLPLNSIYDPFFNQEGSTGLVNGIGKISGRYAVIIASDNKVLAGAWVAGQGENIFRAQEMAEILNIPLVWVLNCSGVKLTEQETISLFRRESRSSQGSTVPIRQVADTMESVPLSCLPTKMPTSPLAVGESSAA
jgi:glutaconyl-CoA decarboxylase